ncbi:asparaginase [Streptomyces sp. VRA16 Mangrove soil]|uniref:asparaginase n=1 Tax=Streptomyces sp. VRA16 Mangrove soil TaxID=2817434 RepID=UPI001A9FD2E9|nr:asparaginase [Streptomyces sp. VRA16 Mangrove soil]MBO1334090.1 asparaginase [Streptomyces sp. VRA16 Mangrove soil]
MRRTLLVVAALLAGLVPTLPAAAKTDDGKPKVAVIGTGGTITGVAGNRADFEEYEGSSLPISDIVQGLRPELDAVARVTTSEGPDKTAMTDYYDLSRQVDRQLRTADAVVVTAGTKSLEELAYFLDLTVRSSKPVIVTGSMRPSNAFSADGPANLYNSIVLAASGRTHCFGTVVMLDDEILAAREATKTSTLRLDTFQAREQGVLGTVDGPRVRLLRAPARIQKCGEDDWRTPFDVSKIDRNSLPRTEIVASYPDSGGEAITAFADAGAKGIVVAGDPSPGEATALRGVLGKGVTVVAAARTGSGAVYDAGAPGVVPAEDLLPQKARILLLLTLATTREPEDIAKRFARYGVPQFTS